jgi:hypothetical protein
MKIRAVLTVLLCNIVALLLIAVTGFLTVRFTSWGHWAVDSSKASSAELASRYGDPVALLERGALLNLWVFGPVIALIVGALAAQVFRRVDWRISTASVVSLVVVLSVPTSLARILATCLYVVLSWLAMKFISSWLRASAPTQAAVPWGQK